jgi:hypothetical protein
MHTNQKKKKKKSLFTGPEYIRVYAELFAVRGSWVNFTPDDFRGCGDFRGYFRGSSRDLVPATKKKFKKISVCGVFVVRFFVQNPCITNNIILSARLPTYEW